MKLSQVVKYYNLLHTKSLNPEYLAMLDVFRSTVLTIQAQPIQIDAVSEDLQSKFNDIETAVKQFEDTIDQLKAQLKTMITDREPEMYQASTDHYRQQVVWENCEYIQQRKMPVDIASSERIRNRIKLHGDWRVPGMIIRPGFENFVEDMVPLDPLYLVDSSHELLEPAIHGFTQEYQRRLRPYCINDTTTDPIFAKLPQNQFGFVFAYNYFNFRPLEVIHRYLEEIYNLLRPGGTVIFTYNECDVAHGVGLAESNFMRYTPGSQIRARAEDLGYEIITNQIGPYNLAWLELRRPGTITSMRGGQTLAKIVQK